MEPSTTTNHLSYQHLEGDIHEFTFFDSTRQSVDDLSMLQQDWINRNTGKLSGIVVRVLYDLRRSGPLPMNYAFKRNADLLRQNPTYQPTQVRHAIVYNPSYSGYGMLSRKMLQLFTPGYIRTEFFLERDAAIRWLLAE